MDRLESSDPARIPGLLEFMLALAPLKQTVTGRNAGRWLIAVAALIATVAVASAASRILYGDDVSPDRSDGVQVDG
jgi:hypothetical protein